MSRSIAYQPARDRNPAGLEIEARAWAKQCLHMNIDQDFAIVDASINDDPFVNADAAQLIGAARDRLLEHAPANLQGPRKLIEDISYVGVSTTRRQLLAVGRAHRGGVPVAIQTLDDVSVFEHDCDYRGVPGN